MLPHLHGYVIATHDCLRGRSRLLALYGNQEGSLGAGLRDGRSHKPVNELFHDHLAREGLRDFDHSRKIELFDRCLDRACWTGRVLALPQPRMELLELPHLSVGSPSEIALPRVSQVEMRDLLEAAGRVKARGQLVGERLVMDKAVCARRRDGVLIKLHGLQRASLDTGNLGANQRGAVLKVLRTMRRKVPKLSCVPSKRVYMLGVWVGAYGVAACGASQRGIEMIFRLFEHKERQRRRPRIPILDLLRCVDRRCVIAGEEPGLELSEPVVAFQKGVGGVTRRALFEGALCEPTIVEGAELRSPSTQRPDERERRRNSVEEESKLPYELQSVLGLILDSLQLMTQGKKKGSESAAGVSRKCRVTVLFCHLEGTARRVDPFSERSCPRDQTREEEIGSSPKVLQSATFEQIARHLSKAITFIVVAKAGAGDHVQCRVVEWCGVAVAALEIEIGGPADTECDQILVGVQGWYTQAGQHVQRRQSLRILHQRKVDEILDRTVSEPGPDALVLTARFRLGGMRRPVDTNMRQAFQSTRHRALAHPKHRVKIHAPLRDSTSLDRSGSTHCERR